MFYWNKSSIVVQECSVKKDILENFAKFTGKHLCQSLFFNKVTGLRPTSEASSIKLRLVDDSTSFVKCFSVNKFCFCYLTLHLRSSCFFHTFELERGVKFFRKGIKKEGTNNHI